MTPVLWGTLPRGALASVCPALSLCPQVAAKALETGTFGAYFNVLTNLKDVDDGAFRDEVSSGDSAGPRGGASGLDKARAVRSLGFWATLPLPSPEPEELRHRGPEPFVGLGLGRPRPAPVSPGPVGLPGAGASPDSPPPMGSYDCDHCCY